MLAPDFKVKKLRDDLCMVDKPARVHCDGKAIKTFFTNINLNLHTSVQKRETFRITFLEVLEFGLCW